MLNALENKILKSCNFLQIIAKLSHKILIECKFEFSLEENMRQKIEHENKFHKLLN